MSEKTVNVAVLGASGAVGETIIEILAERQFPVEKLFLLASERSAGKRINFNDSYVRIEDVANFDWKDVDIALFSAGGSVSAQYAPIATAAGCIVIDNTSHFRYDSDVPLIIPEVNADALKNYTKRNIIANPNCSTIQMLVALKPIYDAVGITRINVATYQSVSGAGQSGISELAKQTAEILNGHNAVAKKFSKQIAFNVLPHIDEFLENGYTREEMKMVWETQKIFNDPNINVNATAVRVPVFFGHSEAIHIETERKITAAEVKKLLRKAPGVVLVNKNEDYPTAVTDAAAKDGVFVGRVREDISHPNGINLWVVADNIRKGAALNAVQIAELLLADF
ncbi:MAG: aspartate-semialdehyde dehydrogenase [Pseudomonadota bacterium]|nr:aspartate-semialdehyde dehydrogenase [Pseudomonadota bacterium]